MDKFTNPDNKVPDKFKNENLYMNRQGFLNTLLSKREAKPVREAKKEAPIEKKVLVKDLRKAIEKAYDPYINMNAEQRKKFATELEFKGKEVKDDEPEKIEKGLRREKNKAFSLEDQHGAEGKIKLWEKVWRQLKGE